MSVLAGAKRRTTVALEGASRRTRIFIPLGALACAVFLQASDLPWVHWARNRAFDALHQHRPRQWTDAGVRVIDIDDASLEKLGQWPWPRTQVARLERRLQELGAAATAYDVFFPEPDRTSPGRIAATWPKSGEFDALRDRVSKLPDHDAILARAIKAGNVVLGITLTGRANGNQPKPKLDWAAPDDAVYALPDYPGAVSNLPVLEDAAAGVGNVGFEPDYDFIIRSVPMLFRRGTSLLPSLSLEALRVAQKENKIAVKTVGKLGDDEHAITALKVGRLRIPLDRNGHVYAYYTQDETSRVIPAWKLFDPSFDASGLEGAITLIGTSAAGLKDIRPTPLDPAAPGVDVHANILEQVITGEFLVRPDWAIGAEIALLALLGLAMLLALERGGAVWSGPLAGLTIAGLIGASWLAFTRWHWLLDPVFPTLGVAAVYASWSSVVFVRTELDKRRITDTFGRYLSPKVVAKLAEKPGAVELGGETREMTFHFCDIRGFTTISEKFDPHGLTVFINNFLTPMTETILEHDGTIDKYMGDCIMAFWNAPMDVPEHARQACRAALKMHARLKELNARWQEEAKAAGKTLPLIEIGTGLNTGPCVVGNMGSSLRVDYTVLGDDVNLASRLEGQSKGYGVKIVIGPRTREQAPEFAAIELDLIKVKGKTEAVRIFALLGSPDDAESTAFKELGAGWSGVLAAYRAQKWDEAEKKLRSLGASFKAYGLEKLAHLYEDRIAHFRAEPPGKDWDGVFVATTK
jgi:adenylate cyclase